MRRHLVDCVTVALYPRHEKSGHATTPRARSTRTRAQSTRTSHASGFQSFSHSVFSLQSSVFSLQSSFFILWLKPLSLKVVQAFAPCLLRSFLPSSCPSCALRMTSVAARAFPSVPVHDVSWESALRALPPPLLAALRAERLDDPGILCEYPRDGTLKTGEKVGGDAALSGAATSRKTPILSSSSPTAPPLDSGVLASCTPASSPVGPGSPTGVTAVGTDPKTGFSLGCGVSPLREAGIPNCHSCSALCSFWWL